MRNTQHTLARLSHTVGRKKAYVLYLALLQAVLGLCSVLSALLFRSLIDRAVAGDREGFRQAVLWLLVLMAGRLALNALGHFLYEWTRATLENQFKEGLFSCLLRKSYASVTAVHSGEWMNRLTSDTAVVAGGIVEIVPGMTGLFIRLLGALTAIFILEPVFMAILIPGGGLILLLTYCFRKVLKRLHKRIQEADGALRVFLQERLGSLMVVRAFAMEEGTERGAEEKMRLHKAARIRRNLLSNLCNTAFGAAANGIYLFGAAYCGWGILQGTVSYGTMTAVLQLIGQVQSPFANLTGYLPRYYAMIASAERLMEAEDYEEDCAGEAASAEEVQNFYQKEFAGIGLKDACFAYPSPEKGTEAENSAGGILTRAENSGRETLARKGNSAGETFSGTEGLDQETWRKGDYTPRPVLKGVSLEIRKGEYAALIGHSGCGKSTLLKLFMSMYPLDAGERYIICRKQSGEEEKRPLTARLRRLFAYVPQGNQLMSGTIREVIALGDPERMKEEERLWQALRISCAEEFVRELEKGLNTVLGERGSGLSEGQMQRIAIARAVFSDRPILMLDESTSALDGETERRLLLNLRAMTDRTVLIITHRPEALRICDKQIAMTEDGGINLWESGRR